MTVPEPILKRLCELNKGDVFLYAGIKRRVVKISNEFIYYKSLDWKSRSSSDKIGAKSLAKVEMVSFSNEIIEPVKPKLEHHKADYTNLPTYQYKQDARDESRGL